MLILQSRGGNPRRRLYRRIAWIALPLIAAAAWLSWTPALTQYHLWKQQNALAQAKGFIAQHDANDAHLALEVAFTVAPGNIDAWRTAAEMLDQVGTPEAVRIRHHITQMLGANLLDQVALVNSALRFRDYNTARDALGSFPKSAANDPIALGAALSFAMETRNSPVADALLDRLRKLTPDNEDFKVAQAQLHLRHPDPQMAAEARKILESEAANPKYALQVERELMTDAMVRKDLPAAKRWAITVAANPQATLSDRLHQANLELLVDKRPFEQVLPPLAQEAAKDPVTIAPFVRWLLAQNHAKEAESWLGTLPPELKKSPVVASAEADVIVQLKDWDRLGPILEAGAWGPIPLESMRLAMSARIVGAHNQGLQHQVWTEAIQAANGSLPAYIVLERLAATWEWATESDDTLWTIARAFPDQTWADEELFTDYRARKDAANMREVMNALRTSDPSVARYQHDWALLTLLVNPSSDWNESKDIMRKLYETDPANPNYATGYAFALAQAGKGPQALAVVSKLSPQDRDYSPRAPYLAYVYGVNRMKADVIRSETQAHGAVLLPEENILFTLAHELESRKALAPPAAPKAKPPTSS